MLHHAFFVNHGRFRGDRRGGDCRTRRGRDVLRHGGGGPSARAPARLRLPDAQARPLARRMDVHEPPPDARPRLPALHGHGHGPSPQVPVTPRWISVSCAAGKIYSVPGDGGVHARSRTWVVPREGGSWPARPTPTAARCRSTLPTNVAAAAGCSSRRALRHARGPDLQPLAGAARAGAAQHEHGHFCERLGGQPRRSPEDHLALRE